MLILLKPGTAEFQRYARCPWTISTPSGKDLTLKSPLRDFAAAFGSTSKPNGKGSEGTRKTAAEGVGVGGQATVQLDRLDAPHMAGLRDIELSRESLLLTELGCWRWRGWLSRVGRAGLRVYWCFD
jgi:hypothetical protein